MPVYAEQKEATSNLDRVVEPNLDSALTDRLKDATVPSSVSGNSASGASSAAAQEVEARISQQQEQQLQEELAASEETLIFFDWDDTLLSSSFLASQGYRLDTDLESRDNYEYVQGELKQLEMCVTSVLNEALQRGKVTIITNAEQGWVELSAQKFIPAVVPYLSKLTVVSARTTYEHMFPEAPLKWKLSAFQDQLAGSFAKDTKRNVLSFGDSHVEREAVRTVTRGVENTKTKSIKFTECPSMDQLRKQLELVASHFHYIHTHDGDLDLMLKMSTVPADA